MSLKEIKQRIDLNGQPCLELFDTKGRICIAKEGDIIELTFEDVGLKLKGEITAINNFTSTIKRVVQN